MTFPFPTFKYTSGLTGHLWTDFDFRNTTGSSVTSWSATNFDIGVPQSNRHVVIVLGIQSIGSATTVGVVVNGVSATQVVSALDLSTGIQEYSGIHVAAVSSGQLVTVQVNLSNNRDYIIMANGYAMYGKQATATHTITDNNSDPATGSLNTVANGAAFGGVFVRSNDGSGGFTWSGLTEDGTDNYIASSSGGSSASVATNGSTISVSADYSGTPFRNPVLTAASFPPV